MHIADIDNETWQQKESCAGTRDFKMDLDVAVVRIGHEARLRRAATSHSISS